MSYVSWGFKPYSYRFLSVGLAAISLLSAIPLQAEAADRTIIMSASGSVQVKPDLAYITTGVETEAENAQDAVKKNSESMSKVLAVLKEAGVEEKDIQTSNFSVQPRYTSTNSSAGEQKAPKLTGYVVNNSATITIQNIEKFGEILDKVVSAGSNTISGISFDVKNKEEHLNKARQAAVNAAIAKAKVYSETAGVKLGRIANIQEGSGFHTEYKMRSFNAEAAQVPVSAGSQELQVQVTVTWELAKSKE